MSAQGRVGLSKLVARVRRRADMENSAYCSDAEIGEYLRNSLAELADLITINGGQEMLATSAAFVTVADTVTVALPKSFYRLLGVDVVLNGETEILRPFMFNERARYSSSVGWTDAARVGYRLVGTTIRFHPTPDAVYSGTFWFIPLPLSDSVGSIILDDLQNTFNGFAVWDEYAVVDAAMKCLEKEESDTSALAARKAQLAARIIGISQKRDAGSPERVQDVTLAGAASWWRPDGTW